MYWQENKLLLKPAHHVKSRKRSGRREEEEVQEAQKQIEKEADYVLKGKMLCL